MRRSFPVMLVIVFLSQGCLKGASANHVYHNEEIDKSIRTTVEALNKQAYTRMCQNNYQTLSQLFSDSLLEAIGPDFTKKFMPQMQRVMKGNEYRVFDEFYITGKKEGDTVSIAAGAGASAYTCKFIAPAKEMYLAMLISGDSVDEVMLTLAYVKVKGDWKLSVLRGEDYSLGGKNAIQQYNYARALQRKDYLIDAVNRMGLSKNCMAPAAYFLRYNNEKEMMSFSDSLTTQTRTKYPFPYLVNELKSKPLVVNIHYERLDGYLTPMIIYQSNVAMTDTAALKAENDDMQAQIGKIFYGMDRSNKAIIYRVYNELPNGQNNPRYYGFVQKIM